MELEFFLTGFPVSSALTSLLTIVKFTRDIAGVPSKIRFFIQILSRISDDLNELTRLRSLHPADSPTLKAPTCKYIDGVIVDAREALHDVEADIENCRADLKGKDGDISVRHRMEWHLCNESKFLFKEKRLMTCHRTVLVCLGMMGADRETRTEKVLEVVREHSQQEVGEVLISPRMWREMANGAEGHAALDTVPVLPPLDFMHDENPPPYRAEEKVKTPWLVEEDARIEDKHCEMLLYMAAQRRCFYAS